MEQKKIVLQIFSGGFLQRETNFKQLKEKLVPVFEQLAVSKVIMGWYPDRQLYQKVRQLTRQYGVELYLWLPVFSEIGLLKPVKILKNDSGYDVKNYQLKAGENFEFYCPAAKENIKAVKEIFNEKFDAIGFDGVFLDKIRYASFANGSDGVFSCFCPTCISRYQEKGLDYALLQEEMQQVRVGQSGYESVPLKITAYQNGKYQFSNPLWEQFFTCKADLIYESIAELTKFFRQKHMKIGLDVFAPFLSYFVGQDVERLGGLVDFVKPMMYRITDAPAGLPFEYRHFLQASGQGSQFEVRNRMNEILGIEQSAGIAFNLPFVLNELKLMKSWNPSVYCGIEINRIDGVVPADPNYIKEYLEQLNHSDQDGYVLSWDLLSAPDENLKTVYQYLEK